jgi:endonuclease/exonuclease/phosphatase family metal-dependent hydrolase
VRFRDPGSGNGAFPARRLKARQRCGHRADTPPTPSWGSSRDRRYADDLVVLGDFNDTLGSAPLAPLAATDLQAAATHPAFNSGNRPGTFGNCTKTESFDHVLLSPALFGKMQFGEIYRTGAWGGVNETLWPHYPSLTKAVEAASDHCAVYVDLNL